MILLDPDIEIEVTDIGFFVKRRKDQKPQLISKEDPIMRDFLAWLAREDK